MGKEETYRILVVEDDQIFRELLVVALTLRGYTVYVAEDGQRAMTVIKNARPHLVTVDLRMPRTDGLRFLEWLRGTRRFGSIPAVVVTAVDDKGIAVDALVAGASDVLTKPVDLEVLASRIASLLAGRDVDASETEGGREEASEPPLPDPAATATGAESMPPAGEAGGEAHEGSVPRDALRAEDGRTAASAPRAAAIHLAQSQTEQAAEQAHE